jgi:hypothetical protein
VVVAGELADLEVEPREGAPYEPWADPVRVEAAVERAEHLADMGDVDAVLFGRARVAGPTFSVELTLTRGGEIVARGEGSGALAEAVRVASTALYAPFEGELVAHPEDVDGLGVEDLATLAFAEARRSLMASSRPQPRSTTTGRSTPSTATRAASPRRARQCS